MKPSSYVSKILSHKPKDFLTETLRNQLSIMLYLYLILPLKTLAYYQRLPFLIVSPIYIQIPAFLIILLVQASVA